VGKMIKVGWFCCELRVGLGVVGLRTGRAGMGRVGSTSEWG